MGIRRHHLFLLPFQFSTLHQIFFSNQKPKPPNTSAATSNSNVTIVRSNAAWLSQHSLSKPAGGVMPAASLIETVLGTLDQRQVHDSIVSRELELSPAPVVE
jgi:hypothetical protein